MNEVKYEDLNGENATVTKIAPNAYVVEAGDQSFTYDGADVEFFLKSKGVENVEFVENDEE